jgi:hypothetical protein
MRWIRQNVRWAARLALFALAVHMYVSFGHVHPDDVAAAYAAGASAASENVASATTPALATTPASATTPNPKHPYRSSVAHDFCAVCAHIGLFSFLILSVPSALVGLQQSDRIGYWDAATIGVASSPRSSFQARAPPLA